MEWTLSKFQLGKKIGHGQFGDVYLAKDKSTNLILALKIIEKQKIQNMNMIEQTIKEIKIHSYCNHPNILQMFGLFDDKKRIYMVMEYSLEGSLFEIIQKTINKKISEKEAALIILQISYAVKYLHQNQIIHRDIKPENILIANGIAKLSDFGISSDLSIEKRKTFCGTLDYVSPELIMGGAYDVSVDIWAIGILCYELCAGSAPFVSQNLAQTYQQILKADIKYPKSFSDELKNFINKILVKNPKQRMTLHEIICHKWIQDNIKDELQQKTGNFIKQFEKLYNK